MQEIPHQASRREVACLRLLLGDLERLCRSSVYKLRYNKTSMSALWIYVQIARTPKLEGGHDARLAHSLFACSCSP